MIAERRRVLIAASQGWEREFQALFAKEPLDQWEVAVADAFSRARFLVQHNPCDLLLVHEDVFEREGPQGLNWLAWQKNVPVVFLGASPWACTRATELGVTLCLHRDMVLDHPPLLAATMKQAMQISDACQGFERTKKQLGETRQHVDRLVTMLWRQTPRKGEQQWYSQPYMLERLEEELARSERHKLPLSLAIGELADEETEEAPIDIPEWGTDLIVKKKRRCDVVGQYGPHGFMLLMVHTPKEGAEVCCKRLQQYFKHPSEELAGPFPSMRAFFGMTSVQGERRTPQELLRLAEQGLESARRETKLRLVTV